MSFGQGGPQWGPGGTGGPGGGPTPDWAALAEASEARARRRKWLMIGGGAFATIGIAAAVAITVVSANSGDATASNKPASELPATADIPGESDEPGPTFKETTPPPPPDPKDFISSAKKDKAPLTPEGLFPGRTFTSGETVYKKGATDSTKSCASVTQPALGAILARHDCTRLIRASYLKGGIAVTIGVAVFDTSAEAKKVKDEVEKGLVTALPGKGVPGFCRTGVCRGTYNAYGRYAYFTTTGYTNGKDVTTGDSKAYAAGDTLARFAFQRINQRGEAQASAAAAAPQ
ncbi:MULTISPECIES: hypothetical protein [Streptomyces]|uniref:hypothetical protein n=1 Tax=Streptomyces TaxID=1883 RepID=UPI001E55AC08|nr:MULTISPECIES: hypothetical protein [Streptomyces]UFQ17487.1 hypothetical protein J2N69_22175 [Streptomyces huasconensis]WCL87093.1 hypothetical protein PPN52_22175 [Streptomyces sp. JCM 35825]